MCSWHLGKSTSFLTPLHTPDSISRTWSQDIPGWHNFPGIIDPAQAAAPSSGSPATHHQAGLGKGGQSQAGWEGAPLATQEGGSRHSMPGITLLSVGWAQRLLQGHEELRQRCKMLALCCPAPASAPSQPGQAIWLWFGSS